MHWQEACKKSKRNRAMRKTKDDRIMIREINGDCIVTNYRCIDGMHLFRKALNEEVESYLDWKPIEEYV